MNGVCIITRSWEMTLHNRLFQTDTEGQCIYRGKAASQASEDHRQHDDITTSQLDSFWTQLTLSQVTTGQRGTCRRPRCAAPA